MRRPIPRRGMHPFIHILFLDIQVAIDMDDSDITVDVRSNASNVREAKAVIATADHRESAGGGGK